MVEMEVINVINNVFGIIDEKEKKLKSGKIKLLRLSRSNIRNKRKFKKRLMKINRQYELFGDEMVDRYISWLFRIKYIKNPDKLNGFFHLYTRDEIKMFCTKERIKWLDKVKVVKRLEG